MQCTHWLSSVVCPSENLIAWRLTVCGGGRGAPGGLRASTLWKLRKYVDEMKTFG